MELINLLDRPGREYTPFPFWFLNDELTADELRRQLQLFRQAAQAGALLDAAENLRQVDRLGTDAQVLLQEVRVDNGAGDTHGHATH